MLLAVQINICNKNREFERSLLTSIKEELSLDALDINFNLNINWKFLKNEIALLNLMTNPSIL